MKMMKNAGINPCNVSEIQKQFERNSRSSKFCISLGFSSSRLIMTPPPYVENEIQRKLNARES